MLASLKRAALIKCGTPVLTSMQKNEIGYATSSDGINWTRYGSSPVLDGGYNASEYWASEPSVFYENGNYKMWYTGWTAAIAYSGLYYATSSDGINWTRQGKVIDHAVSVSVKRYDTTKLIMACWIEGQGNNCLGFYTSADGATWTRINNGGIPMVSGKDTYGQITPDIVRMTASTWYLYYGQVGESTWTHNRIGVAISGDYALTLSDGSKRAEIGLNLHGQDDFDDLRFTGSNGVTLLDYWIDPSQYVSGEYAVGWVELGSVGTSATNIFIYYGNASATSISNGTNTFILFDNFERGNDGGTIGGAWTEYTDHVHISTDHAFSGTRSAKWVGAAGYPEAYLSVTPW